MMLPSGWQGDAPGLQKWVQRWVQKGEAEEVRLAHFSISTGPNRNVREVGQVSCEEFGGDDLIQEVARILGLALGQLDVNRNETMVAIRVFELDAEDQIAIVPDSREGLFAKPFVRQGIPGARVAPAPAPAPISPPAFPGSIGAPSGFMPSNVPAPMPLTNLPTTPTAFPAGARMSPDAAATAARVAGGQSATDVEQARMYAAMDPQMAMMFAMIQNNQFLVAQVVAIARESIQAQTVVAQHYSSAAMSATSRLEQNLEKKAANEKQAGADLIEAEKRIAAEKLRAEQARADEIEKQAAAQRAAFEAKLAALKEEIANIKPAASAIPAAPADGGAGGMFQAAMAAVAPQVLAQLGNSLAAPAAPAAPSAPAAPAAPAGTNALASMAQNMPPAQMAAMIIGTDKARLKEILKAMAAMDSDAAVGLGVSLAEALDGEGAVGAPPPPPVTPAPAPASSGPSL